MSDSNGQSDAYEEPSMDARDLYDPMTDEEARKIGRELLQLADDGLKLDHRRGQVVIGDTAVQICLFPHGVGSDDPRYSQFRYEFLTDHAENWWLNEEDACLELSWTALDREADDE